MAGGDRQWRARLTEWVETLGERLVVRYGDAPRPKLSEVLSDPEDYPIAIEDAAFQAAHHWLLGAAEALDVTLWTMLDEAGLSESILDEAAIPRSSRRGRAPQHLLPCTQRPCGVCDTPIPFAPKTAKAAGKKRRR